MYTQVREILGQAAQAEICGSTYMNVCMYYM